MRVLVIIAFLVALPAAARVYYVGGAAASQSDPGATMILGYTAKVGNTVVLGISLSNAASCTLVSVADDGGNTYTLRADLGAINGPDGNGQFDWVYTAPIVTAMTFVSVVTASCIFMTRNALMLGEYAGVGSVDATVITSLADIPMSATWIQVPHNDYMVTLFDSATDALDAVSGTRERWTSSWDYTVHLYLVDNYPKGVGASDLTCSLTNDGDNHNGTLVVHLIARVDGPYPPRKRQMRRNGG